MNAKGGVKGRGKAFSWVVEHVGYQGDDCLIWPYSRDPQGYGQMGLSGRIWKAYRLMCVLAHGEPPSKAHHASHLCGNGHQGCTNPRHLAWKTISENQLDRARHGTKNRGHMGIGQRGKLTREQIRQVQELRGKLPIVKIAEQFGIKRGTVDYHHRKAREQAA